MTLTIDESLRFHLDSCQSTRHGQPSGGKSTDNSPMNMPLRPPPPRIEFVYDAVVEVAPRVDLGEAPLGQRFIVPITGGRFEGPRLRGQVLAGGADRQLLRHDGIKELEAIYEMQTDDGVVLSIRNLVLIDDPPGGPRQVGSHVSITAPRGPYDWMNRRRFTGTLRSLAPEQAAVLISVYSLE